MGSLKETRDRIRSVKNTRKITNAMKMIAASRLKKAQVAVEAQRPYANRLREVIATLAARAEQADHPLLAVRPPKKVLLLVFTSDKGMCGGFNVNITRTTVKYVAEHTEHESVMLSVIGKKGQGFFGRRPQYTIQKNYQGVFDNINLGQANEIGDDIVNAFVEEGLDACYIVYNEFKSAIAQTPVVERLLPIVPDETDADESLLDFKYEPDKHAVLEEVLPLYVNVQIYRAILESIASEMGSRMTAMDNATRNAGELIDRLTLQYNRARQAAITTELMEIIGGAEALKG
ncbi:MAG: F-type H+-transporting ATPase subunit gamma [Myxococcota bacterium]|jgi:F-type H+-transporting ATPase subunit gamma